MHHQARDAVASRLATQFTHFVSFTVEIAKHSTYYSQHITRHIKTNGKGAHLIAWRSSRLNSNTSTPRDVGLTQFRRCVCSHAVTVHTRHTGTTCTWELSCTSVAAAVWKLYKLCTPRIVWVNPQSPQHVDRGDWTLRGRRNEFMRTHWTTMPLKRVMQQWQ